MAILDIFASFSIAVLSGMGIGSGGLFVIYLTLVSGAPQLAAQGMNLLFFLFSSGAALLYHLLRRRIFWNAVLLLTLTGIGGSLLGSLVAGLLPVALIKKLFGVMLMTSGAVALFQKKRPQP